MRTKAVQILAALFGLTVLSAGQDLLPAFAGVKPPLLACFTLGLVPCLSLPAALLLAGCAGLVADALSGLPPGCATSFLPLLALAAYLTPLKAMLADDAGRAFASPLGGLAVGAAACALGEVWTAAFGVSDEFSPLVRLAAALPLGALTGAALVPAVPFVFRHIGLEREDAA